MNGKMVKGYKGFHPGLICKGKQYAENTIFKEEEATVCEKGMHFCTNPFHVLHFYSWVNSDGYFADFAEVEALGECRTNDDKKYVTTELKIKDKIDFNNYIDTCIKFSHSEFQSAPLERLSEEQSYHFKNNEDDKGFKFIFDYTKITNTGNGVVLANGGPKSCIENNGSRVKIFNIGDDSDISNTGAFTNILNKSLRLSKIINTGNFPIIINCGKGKIINDGYEAIIINSNEDVVITNSGNGANIGNKGSFTHILNNGISSKIANSGNLSYITNQSSASAIGNSGNNVRIVCNGSHNIINDTGKNSIIMCAGAGNIVKAKKGSWITLCEWTNNNFNFPNVVTKCVDGDEIKEDTFYRLFDNKFIEAVKY